MNDTDSLQKQMKTAKEVEGCLIILSVLKAITTENIVRVWEWKDSILIAIK